MGSLIPITNRVPFDSKDLDKQLVFVLSVTEDDRMSVHSGVVMCVLLSKSHQFIALLIGQNLCKHACSPCHDLTPRVIGRT